MRRVPQEVGKLTEPQTPLTRMRRKRGLFFEGRRKATQTALPHCIYIDVYTTMVQAAKKLGVVAYRRASDGPVGQRVPST